MFNKLFQIKKLQLSDDISLLEIAVKGGVFTNVFQAVMIW